MLILVSLQIHSLYFLNLCRRCNHLISTLLSWSRISDSPELKEEEEPVWSLWFLWMTSQWWGVHLWSWCSWLWEWWFLGPCLLRRTSPQQELSISQGVVQILVPTVSQWAGNSFHSCWFCTLQMDLWGLLGKGTNEEEVQPWPGIILLDLLYKRPSIKTSDGGVFCLIHR